MSERPSIQPRWFLLLIFLAFLMSGCASLVPSPTATPTDTPLPTNTPTSSPTSTLTLPPTQTSTPTPSPTPLGGGSGQLFFSISPWLSFDDVLSPSSEENGIYSVSSNGEDLKQILNRSQIENLLGSPYRTAHFTAHHGIYFILTNDSLYSVSNDWQLIDKLELKNSCYRCSISMSNFSLLFSPDNRHIMWPDNSYKIFISDIISHDTYRALRSIDYPVNWSADGSLLIYKIDYGRAAGLFSIDNAQKEQLSLDSFPDYHLYANATLEPGTTSVYYYPTIDTYAVSPDIKNAAFTWNNLLFTVSAADTEFLEPHLLTELPSMAYSLIWSPDGKYLLVGLYSCFQDGSPTSFSCNYGDIALLNVEQAKIETIFPSKELNSLEACGFSPDGKQILFHHRYWEDEREGISLISLDGTSANALIEIDGTVSCPVWK